jgi:hypothetical protein
MVIEISADAVVEWAFFVGILGVESAVIDARTNSSVQDGKKSE